MVDHPIYGFIHTPNLTTGVGGVGRYYSDEDWVRAIRHGVNPQGRGIAFMPTDHYWHLSDADLGAIIAYLKQLPPFDNDKAGTRLNIFTRALINSGAKGNLVRASFIPHQGPRPATSNNQAAYLLQIGGCDFCHGADLRGGQGPEPGAPPAPSLANDGPLADWVVEDFVRVMRTGQTPDGRVIVPAYMPWVGYMHMSDADLVLIWDYLRQLPPTS